RCLRFTNAVANVGEGPLDMRLPFEQVPAQHFLQRVWRADGSFEDVPSAPAEWHPIDRHWHNGAANEFTVYKYDIPTGARGEAVGHGRKTGICYADVGLVALDQARMAAPRHDGSQCFDPAPHQAWAMGLQPGWFDSYDWILADQYVEMSGVPDGTYAL